ncbi:hypothetical protein C8J56DRAFT_290653 [Mycena floridula]|nr:hypothetical protein C8J56DRAFT_290653 [Mycena floridula]
MRFQSLIALTLAAVVLAEDHLVTVGADNLFAFAPNSLVAAVGDTITFQFLTRNHSATTTTFVNPCPPPPGGFGDGGFDTGFHPSVTTGDAPEATVTIVDLEPHWVSCMQAAGAHCRLGMTLSINPPPDMTEAQFMANAIAST